MGSVSFIPQTAADAAVSTGPSLRGGDTEPTRLTPINDPVLRAAFMRAEHAWAKRWRPWLLQEWLNV